MDKKIHDWVRTEKNGFLDELSKIKNLKVHKSSTNFFFNRK